MLDTEVKAGTAIYVPFYEADRLEGKTSFNVFMLKDNELFLGLLTPPVLTEFGSGLYSLLFTFPVVGRYTIAIDGNIQAYVNVVYKESKAILKDLDDSAQGSYLYDKRTGLLTLLRQNGSVLRTYTVVDNNEQTSRELIS